MYGTIEGVVILNRSILPDGLWQWFKDLLPEGYRTGEPVPKNSPDYLKECAEKNRQIALVIVALALVMEIFMVFCYGMQKAFFKETPFFPQYIYLYLSMIVFASLFLILLNFKTIKESSSRLMKLEYVILTVFGIWSAVFSAFDVINGFSSYLFVQLMIINSLFFRMNPVKHCVINGVSFLVYTVMILVGKLGLVITFSELINPFFMLVAACALILLHNRIRYSAYRNRNLIKEQNKQLAYYANYDFLTKIPNRKWIMEYFDQILLQKNDNTACMMIDIDNFKLYNDTYGHIMGDSCLIRLSAVMEEYVLNQGGKLGRYGGEEFLVLFVNQEEERMIGIANELVRLIRAENIEFADNGDFGVATISIGLCVKNEEEPLDQYAMLSLADQALYRAKKEGKSKISLYRKEEQHASVS